MPRMGLCHMLFTEAVRLQYNSECGCKSMTVGGPPEYVVEQVLEGGVLGERLAGQEVKHVLQSAQSPHAHVTKTSKSGWRTVSYDIIILTASTRGARKFPALQRSNGGTAVATRTPSSTRSISSAEARQPHLPISSSHLLILQLQRPHRRRVGQHAAHPRAAGEHQRHRAAGAAAVYGHTRIQRVCMIWVCHGAVPAPLTVRLTSWARATVHRVRA